MMFSSEVHTKLIVECNWDWTTGPAIMQPILWNCVMRCLKMQNHLPHSGMQDLIPSMACHDSCFLCGCVNLKNRKTPTIADENGLSRYISCQSPQKGVPRLECQSRNQ
jgi:hypothetical protein